MAALIALAVVLFALQAGLKSAERLRARPLPVVPLEQGAEDKALLAAVHPDAPSITARDSR